MAELMAHGGLRHPCPNIPASQHLHTVIMTMYTNPTSPKARLQLHTQTQPATVRSRYN